MSLMLGKCPYCIMAHVLMFQFRRGSGERLDYSFHNETCSAFGILHHVPQRELTMYSVDFIFYFSIITKYTPIAAKGLGFYNMEMDLIGVKTFSQRCDVSFLAYTHGLNLF